MLPTSPRDGWHSLDVGMACPYTGSIQTGAMNNTAQKRTHRSVAASAVFLAGSGLVLAGQPAQATVSAKPAGVAGVTRAPIRHVTRSAAKGPLIVYRSAMVAGTASISAAPRMSPTVRRAKRRHHRSRRS